MIRLQRGMKVWVRDNVTKLYHPGEIESIRGNGLYYLRHCTFVWCYREDIRTTKPRKNIATATSPIAVGRV